MLTTTSLSLQVNLELVSLLFQTKIQVFYINEDNQLSSFIINHRHKRKIEIFVASAHYNPAFSRKFMELITISQKITEKVGRSAICLSILSLTTHASQIIDESIGLQRRSNEAFVNYEYENWLNNRIE